MLARMELALVEKGPADLDMLATRPPPHAKQEPAHSRIVSFATVHTSDTDGASHMAAKYNP